MIAAQNKFPRKELFDLPEGVIYLDGNSLGPPVKQTTKVTKTVVEDEWGKDLISAWNTANWLELPQTVGNLIAPLIGVSQGSVSVGDTLSIKLYQALAAALSINPQRKVVLTDSGNFPTDLYIAQGLVNLLDKGHQLKIVAPEQVQDELNEDVAAVYLTHVDYRTGRKHSIESITKKAHGLGVITIWDLAHSVGAMPLYIEPMQAEFAVGCTYKYLNGGPGAPAFIYVRPDIIDLIQPVIPGWLGHKQPFAMTSTYVPAPTVARFRIGTPSVIQSKILKRALEIWEDVDLEELWDASTRLTERFINEVESRCPDFELISPRDAQQRGSHVSFAYDHSYAIIQALIDRGVVGDFREPNLMRFGFAPFYLNEDDIVRAAEIMEEIVSDEIWSEDKYQMKKPVT